MSRDLQYTHPGLRSRIQNLIRWARIQLGLDVIVTCTYRSGIEQDKLYVIGRDKRGKRITLPNGKLAPVLTNAKAGESYHNFEDLHGFPLSRAVDLAWIRHDGKKIKAMYSFPKEFLDKAESLGLDCGARFPGSFKDGPHFQYSFDDLGQHRTLKQLWQERT